MLNLSTPAEMKLAYERAYENFHFEKAKKSFMRTFVYYALPIICAYSLLDALYVPTNKAHIAAILRLSMITCAIISMYAFKITLLNLKQLKIILATIIVAFSLFVNIFILITNYELLYWASIVIIPLCGFYIYPYSKKINFLFSIIIFSPAVIIYLLTYKTNSNVPMLINYSIFYFSTIMALIYQAESRKKALDEEFNSKWLLTTQINPHIQTTNYKKNNEVTHSIEEIKILAKNFVHDIKSPIGALQILSKSIPNIQTEHQEIIDMLTQRIHQISKDVEGIYSKDPARIEMFNLNDAINKIVIEKQIVHHSVNNRVYDLDLKSTKSAHVLGHEPDFLRIISNIINNSIEATETDAVIKLTSMVKVDSCIIKIADTGIGIPPHLLKKIGENGFSFNKPDGMGIALFNAKALITGWGGYLKLSSVPNAGTEIEITLKLFL